MAAALFVQAQLSAASAQEKEGLGFAPSMFHSFRDTIKKATPDFDFKIWASDREKALKAYRKGNFRKAHKRFKDAAEDGDILASWWLGRMYQLGQGVSQDHALAFQHFRTAATAFDATEPRGTLFNAKLDSLVHLGRYYRSGIETINQPPQPKRAFYVFRKSAQYGHPGAQFNIGDMMFSGAGTPQNKRRGVRWIMLAARKHYAPAQAKLGDIYFNSPNADNRESQAYMWYTLATTAARPEEYPEIFNRYDSLSNEVTDRDRELGREMALSWSQRYPAPFRRGTEPVPVGSKLSESSEASD
ncbi:MAG: tetratricopeptide repeat protein [Hyphomicrobiales bacterium]